MANFRLNMTCDNAAFEEDLRGEISRILRVIARHVETPLPHETDFYQTILDVNGNDVGRWRLAINRQD